MTMTTTTIPVEEHSLRSRAGVLAAIAALFVAAALSVGIVIAQSDSDDAPRGAASAGTSSGSARFGSADAAERWSSSAVVTVESNSRFGSADAAERSAND